MPDTHSSMTFYSYLWPTHLDINFLHIRSYRLEYFGVSYKKSSVARVAFYYRDNHQVVARFVKVLNKSMDLFDIYMSLTHTYTTLIQRRIRHRYARGF